MAFAWGHKGYRYYSAFIAIIRLLIMTDALTRDAEALRDRLLGLPFGELPDLDTLEWMAAMHERMTKTTDSGPGPIPEARKMNYDWTIGQDYITSALKYREAVNRMKQLGTRETEPLLPEEKNYDPKADPYLRVADARWKIADFARKCAGNRKTDLNRLWKDVIEPIQVHLYTLTRPGPAGLRSVVATPLEGTSTPIQANSDAEGPSGKDSSANDVAANDVAGNDAAGNDAASEQSPTDDQSTMRKVA